MQSNQNPYKIVCVKWHIDPKMYTEVQRTWQRPDAPKAGRLRKGLTLLDVKLITNLE